jgi:RHS repeat-associated protein
MLGTTRMMTDEAGAADHRLGFTAFGEPLPLPGYGDPPGAPPQASTRYGFAGAWGYQHDALTSATSAPAGLLHVGYRWYSPSIGRFIQRDPIGLAGGLNAYVYAFNIPTNGVDPDGRRTLGGSLAITAVSVAIVATLASTSWNYLNQLGYLAGSRRDTYNNFNVHRFAGPTPAYPGVPIDDIVEAVGGIARSCPGTSIGGPLDLPTSPEEAAPSLLPFLEDFLEEIWGDE